MRLTPYNEINNLLEELLREIQAVLGEELVALYLYGSLVWGDFDVDISDIDLLAATREDVTSEEFLLLDQMQHRFVAEHERWNDRIETAYMSVEALRTFKTRRSQIAIISPGEPFHLKEAGNDWLLNWYLVRQRGAVLFGPNPQALIEPISKEEYVDCVRRQALDWRDWISHTKDSRAYQGYAILTMCRALYAVTNGEQVSKRGAAEWAMQVLPEKAGLIRNALQWRDESPNGNVDGEATYAETVEFVNFMIDKIVRWPGV